MPVGCFCKGSERGTCREVARSEGWSESREFFQSVVEIDSFGSERIF
jgi:hypothetical protein